MTPFQFGKVLTLAEAPVHDLSGFFPLLRFSFGSAERAVELPTYFIVISLVACICILWAVRRADQRGLDRNRALDIVLFVMIGGLLGARIMHVLFEEPTYYRQDLSRILEIWRGGFVWYGGALGGFAAGISYLKWKKVSFGAWFDLAAPICALGYSLGRIACLLTGCCFGEICLLSNGWRFRYPTQLFAIVSEFLVVIILLLLERRRERFDAARWLRAPGSLFAVWIVLHAIGRIIMELLRADPRGPDLAGLSQATWLSLLLLVTGATFLLRSSRR